MRPYPTRATTGRTPTTEVPGEVEELDVPLFDPDPTQPLMTVEEAFANMLDTEMSPYINVRMKPHLRKRTRRRPNRYSTVDLGRDLLREGVNAKDLMLAVELESAFDLLNWCQNHGLCNRWGYGVRTDAEGIYWLIEDEDQEAWFDEWEQARRELRVKKRIDVMWMRRDSLLKRMVN